MMCEITDYRDVLGSDVPNDGMYLELRDGSDSVAACVFRSDATGVFEVHIGPAVAPPAVIDAFVERAKKHLLDRASG
jgi:hypothetical protein